MGDLWEDYYREMVKLGYYRIIEDVDLGYIVCLIDANDIHSREVLISYIKECLDNYIKIGHIVNELESNSYCDFFIISLDNSMNTPDTY